MPPSVCPVCGRRADAATSLRGDFEPASGDLSLCISCGAVLKFDAELQLQRVDPNEVAALPPAIRAELDRTRGAITSMWREMGRPT